MKHKHKTRTEEAYERLTGEHPTVPSESTTAIDALTTHWDGCAACKRSPDGFCAEGMVLYQKIMEEPQS